jgi:hypothetical protein
MYVKQTQILRMEENLMNARQKKNAVVLECK